VVSQILAVLSPLAVTNHFPSGLKAKSRMNPLWPVNTAKGSPGRLAQSHRSSSFLSSHNVITRVPSGLKAATCTPLPLAVWRTTRRPPVLASQTRAAPSQLAVTTHWPLELKLADETLCPCPGRSNRILPVRASHNLADVSKPAVTICVLSGLKAASTAN
jgi:hypothetical protein